MEKLLLTVWEAADVLSVRRSRVRAALRRAARRNEDRSVSATGTTFGAAPGEQSIMNSRRPHVKAPTGSPGYVWTDTFPLVLLRAVAERQSWRAQYDQSQSAAAAVDSPSATGNDPPTRRLTAARPHPMTSQTRPARLAVKSDRSPSLRIGEAEPQPPTQQEGRR